MSAERIERMTSLLHTAMPDADVTIVDESHLHAGHAGAKTGLGHFALTIKSMELNGLNRVKQHQAIYSALGDMMRTDIHALSIQVIQ